MILNLLRKAEIPYRIPKELEDKIDEFSKFKNKEIFLKKSFFYIVNRWGDNRINLILRFPRIFQNDLNRIIKTKGYMHCTTMNHLLRVMAVKSGFFKDSDLQLKLTNSWYLLPHQYLKVKINSKKMITLDPWNYQYGIKFGRHGSGFDSIRLESIR